MSPGTAGARSELRVQELRDRGFEVFTVNPNADEVDGDPFYHDLKSIPSGTPGWSESGPRPQGHDVECTDPGVRHLWMHRSFRSRSVSDAATTYGRERGATL